MIILGVALLIVGFIAQVAVIWTLGTIAIVVGAVLAIAGGTGGPSAVVATTGYQPGLYEWSVQNPVL